LKHKNPILGSSYPIEYFVKWSDSAVPDSWISLTQWQQMHGVKRDSILRQYDKVLQKSRISTIVIENPRQ